jgi:hypothetical protein
MGEGCRTLLRYLLVGFYEYSIGAALRSEQLPVSRTIEQRVHYYGTRTLNRAIKNSGKATTFLSDPVDMQKKSKIIVILDSL